MRRTTPPHLNRGFRRFPVGLLVTVVVAIHLAYATILHDDPVRRARMFTFL